MERKLSLRSISFVGCLLAGLLVSNCTSTQDTSEKIEPISPLQVTKDYAKQISNIFQQTNSDPNARLSAEVIQDSSMIQSTLTYSDANQPVFHIINYKNGKGWTIISADRRMSPILAYSKKGKMVLENLGAGLSLWVDGVTGLMKDARSKLTTPNEMVENRWKYYESKGGITTPNARVANGPCSSYDIYMHQCPQPTTYAHLGYPGVGDLAGGFANNWSQTGGFAYSCPGKDPFNTAASCSLCANNTVTGCTPLATAIVLRANFHNFGTRKPASGYDWDLMDDATTTCNYMTPGTIEVSRLILFTYAALSAHDQDQFSCQISVSNSVVPGAFQLAGYSNYGTVSGFPTNQGSLQADLHAGYPVVMTGFKSGTSLSGHAWVVDGFYQNTYYNLDCSGYSPVCQESSSLFYHINWGEGDQPSAPNGWYQLGAFVMGSDTYNTNLQATVGVRP